MIVGKIAQAVLKLIMPDVLEHMIRVFKVDKLVDYMELPNEADRGVLKLQDQINILQGELKNMAKVAHTPAIDLKEWNDVKDVIKKLQNKKIFKKLGK